MANDTEEILIKLYKQTIGESPTEVSAIINSGSNRHYYRLKGKRNVVGVIGTSLEENIAFITIAKHFNSVRLPAPQVIAQSDDNMAYLQEDLGDISLFNAIENGRISHSFSTKEEALLIKTIRLLPKIQFEAGKNLDYNVCYPTSEFNSKSIMWDLNYFKYCFLKVSGIDFQENDLEDDFEHLCHDLLNCSAGQTFMYRDFQSRNILIKDGEPYLIDFQGGRKGPIYYDIASFLWQAKANIPADLRAKLIDEYLDSLKEYTTIDRNTFDKNLRIFVLFRTLQVLGAYGFRGYIEKKQHFIQSIPFAINNLINLLSKPFEEYPYLNLLLSRITQLEQFSNIDVTNSDKLTVRINSFSYKKGIPEDYSGNGGGFVFDCRATHNPGRYKEYKHLTGLDAPVIKFLEDNGEITTFLSHVYSIVDASVSRYIQRGFTNLMVSFGCTGGQHRSVYSAQHLAEHLHELFDINIELNHIEQHKKQYFTSKQS